MKQLAGNEFGGQMEDRADRQLAVFLAEIETIRRYSPQTVRAYRSDLARFGRFCGPLFEQPVQKIATAELIGRFLAEGRRTGDSARTVARRASAVRSFFRYLAREGLLAGDVSDLFPSIKLPRSIPRYLTAEIMIRWLESIPEETLWQTRDKAIVITFYSTGARLAEVAGLHWGEIDFNRREVVLHGKRDKQRIVPFGDVGVAILTKYRDLLSAEFGKDRIVSREPVFLNRRGKVLGVRSYSSILNKYFAEVSGGSTVHPHLLRHTFATHLLNGGADLMAIKDLLGHVNVGTTQVYTHVSGTHLKKTYNRAFPRAEEESK